MSNEKRPSPMNCADVNKILVFTLEDLVAPGERRLIEQHLAGCLACRRKWAAMAATRKSAAQALQGLVAQAEPSPQAWDRLQARLAKESRLHQQPPKKTVWNARPAPRAGRTLPHPFQGDFTMRTRILIPALLAVAVIAVLGLFLARNATPVSAQQVLERAYRAKSVAANAVQGIHHTRIETYLNLQRIGKIPGVERTIYDSYLDLSNGIYRNVWTDAATGQVLEASGFDGSYIYTSRSTKTENENGPLTLYRTPQSIDKVADQMVDKGNIDPENNFEAIRNKPDITSATQGIWTDGRAVYILRAESPQGMGEKLRIKNFAGSTLMVFDAKTYDMLENSLLMQQDGQEVVLTSRRKLVDETLPAGSPVVWDLSDVQGLTRVDDPTGEHGDLLPEVITPQELAARTSSGYLLKNVPAGFNLEISSPPRQQNETQFIYIASYRTAENDYFVIQSGKAPEKLASLGEDTFQTASGLALYFLPTKRDEGPNGKEYTLAVVTAPDGAQFMLTSTLPREQVQQLAEDLERVK